MSCPCNDKINVELECASCGRLLTIRVKEDVNALDVAKKQNKKCTKCGSKDFIGGETNQNNPS